MEDTEAREKDIYCKICITGKCHFCGNCSCSCGAATTLLIKRTKAYETSNTEKPVKICEDCGGSGICSECNGEGFVLEKLSDESAEKARMTAKNMATRYTVGLPKKWSYCTKCSSSRSCSTCGGCGQLSW